MTMTEAKALALVTEVVRERGYTNEPTPITREYCTDEALCRAIERLEATEARHAAELREQAERFSEVLGQIKKKFIPFKVGRTFDELAAPFILPAPDPLVEAWVEATGNTVGMGPLNEALAKRGGKIVWEAGE